jgi:beta-galactosidase
VIAPMLYMVREGFAERAEAFVAGRASGDDLLDRVVNETDLCHLGGFPGPLRSCWASGRRRLTAWMTRERNLVQGLAGNAAGLQGPYQVRHLC